MHFKTALLAFLDNLPLELQTRFPFVVSELFDDFNFTTQFMTMAINRSVDFTKLTNNVALLPRMDTFNIKEAVDMAVKCLNNLHSGRVISLLPYSPNLSSNLVSDKHWIVENLICLISNATKYSGRGSTITVSIQLDEECTVDLFPHRSCLMTHKKGSERSSQRTVGTSSDRFLVAIVEDHGIGVTDHDKLFQPFGTDQQMAGGTGLGLYSLASRTSALKGSYSKKFVVHNILIPLKQGVIAKLRYL